MVAVQAGENFFPSLETQTTKPSSKHTLFQGAEYLEYVFFFALLARYKAKGAAFGCPVQS